MAGPVKKFKAGSISATVWKNVQKGKDGKEYTVFSVNTERSYLDPKSEEWKTTNSFKVNDLPKLKLVVEQAYTFLIQESKELADSDSEE